MLEKYNAKGESPNKFIYKKYDIKRICTKAYDKISKECERVRRKAKMYGECSNSFL